MSIRRRLLIALSVLAVLPALILALFSYSLASRTLERNVRSYSSSILFQTATNLQTRVDKVDEVSFNVALDQHVQKTLALMDNANTSALSLSKAKAEAERFLASQVLFHDEVKGITLESKDGHLIFLDKTSLKAPTRSDDLKQTVPLSGSAVWLVDDGNLVLGRTVNSVVTQKPLGTLFIDVPEEFFAQVMSETQGVLGGDILVMNEEATVITGTDPTQAGFPVLELAPLLEGNGASFQTVHLAEGQAYVSVSEPLNNGWRVIAAVPVEVYLQDVNTLRNLLLLGAAATFAVFALTAALLAKSLSRPIHELKQEMRSFGEGNLEVRSSLDREDEIGELATAFNGMADNIDRLIHRVQEEEENKRYVEVRALRMQINPHFLYNTLDGISWAARRDGAEDAATMTKSLGDLFRATIDSQDLVPLHHELDALRHYTQIQNYRYGDRLQVEFAVAEDVLELHVPTLIFQPIVENAIIHGIGPAYGPGVVTVRAFTKADMLLLQVEDTGVGMDPHVIANFERAAADRSQPSTQDQSRESIGVMNVLDRLRVTYGDAAIVKIESEIGEGTRVTISLPLDKNRNKKKKEEEQL